MENYQISYEKFVHLCYKLLDMIRKKGDEYDGIICPLRGGFFLSYFMSLHLRIPMHYIDISSYEGNVQGDIELRAMPEITGGNYLLCDDIYDTGKTIRYVKSLFPGVSIDVICLASKIREAEATYALLVDKGVWVDFFWEVM